MKQVSAFRKFIYPVAGHVSAVSLLIFAGMQIIDGIDLEKPKGWVKDYLVVRWLVDVLQELSIPIYVAIGIIVAACWVVRRMSDPWVLEKVKFILDEYRFKCFGKYPQDPEDHHRITLFRYQGLLFTLERHWSATSWRNPWGKTPIFSGWFNLSKYLVPILRSGRISQKAKANFFVCDDSAKSEGLAGLAWSSGGPIIKRNLPDLKAGTANKQRRAVSEYANETKCNEDMINLYLAMGRPMPRSIAAIPVMVKDEIWGVIVLDSRYPDGITDDMVSNYELTVAIIGQLLEKI